MPRLVAVIVALLALPVAARAQGGGEAPPSEGAAAEDSAKPAEEVSGGDKTEEPPAKAEKKSSGSSGEMVPVGSPKARMTLPAGKFIFTVVGEANMAKGSAGKPLSVAPDL